MFRPPGVEQGERLGQLRVQGRGEIVGSEPAEVVELVRLADPGHIRIALHGEAPIPRYATSPDSLDEDARMTGEAFGCLARIASDYGECVADTGGHRAGD